MNTLSLSALENAINIDLNIVDVCLNLIIAAILSYILQIVFINCSKTLNNKKIFSNNFVIIATTTAFIITIVKSSLALSLGLVGALSIIRFRTAVKEPEEISYLFICIAIGLGLGANYKIVTIISFIIIIIIIFIKSFIGNKEIKSENLYISIYQKKEMNLNEILKIFKLYCDDIFLRDFNLNNEMNEVGIIVNFKNEEDLQKIISELKTYDQNLEINIINKNTTI